MHYQPKAPIYAIKLQFVKICSDSWREELGLVIKTNPS